MLANHIGPVEVEALLRVAHAHPALFKLHLDDN
jgi:hypothetical protein